MLGSVAERRCRQVLGLLDGAVDHVDRVDEPVGRAGGDGDGVVGVEHAEVAERRVARAEGQLALVVDRLARELDDGPADVGLRFRPVAHRREIRLLVLGPGHGLADEHRVGLAAAEALPRSTERIEGEIHLAERDRDGIERQPVVLDHGAGLAERGHDHAALLGPQDRAVVDDVRPADLLDDGLRRQFDLLLALLGERAGVADEAALLVEDVGAVTEQDDLREHAHGVLQL